MFECRDPCATCGLFKYNKTCNPYDQYFYYIRNCSSVPEGHYEWALGVGRKKTGPDPEQTNPRSWTQKQNQAPTPSPEVWNSRVYPFWVRYMLFRAEIQKPLHLLNCFNIAELGNLFVSPVTCDILQNHPLSYDLQWYQTAICRLLILLPDSEIVRTSYFTINAKIAGSC